MNVRRAALCFLVVVATACAGRTTPAPPPAVPAPATPVPAPSPEVPLPVETPVPPPASAVLNGTVTYRQRVALTPEAEVHVELRDVPPANGEPILIAKKVITRPGQVPVAFTLTYDPSRILDGHSYVVSARIADRGQLAFVTESPIPVLTGDVSPAIEILVAPIR